MGRRSWRFVGHRAAVAAAVLSAALASPARAGLPGDCVAVAWASSLNQCLKDLGAFFGQVQPGMNEQMLAMLLGQSLNNPTLAGVDRSKPAYLVVLNPRRYGRRPVAFLLPLASREALEQALAGSMSKTRREDGLWSFKTPRGREILVSFVGGYAAAARKPALCRAAAALAEQGGLPKPRGDAGSTFAAQVDVAKLWAAYKPLLMNFVQRMKQGLAAALQQRPQQGVDARRVTAMLEAEFGALVSFLDQSDQWSLGLTLNGSGAKLRSVWTFQSDTPLSNWLALQEPNSWKLLRSLPQDVIAAACLRVDGLDQSTEWYLGFLESLAGERAGDTMPKIRASIQEWVANAGNEFAFALLTPSGPEAGLEGVYVVSVKDPAAAKRLLAGLGDTVKVWNDFQSLMASHAAVEFRPNVGSYRGCVVHSYRTLFHWEKLRGPQSAAVRALFGDALNSEITVAKNQLVFVFGKQPRKRLQQAVDLILDGGPSLADAALPRNVFGSIPADRSGMGVLSLSRGLKLARLMAPVPDYVKYESDSGVGVTWRCRAGAVETTWTAPMGEIVSIKNAALAIKMGPPRPPAGQPR